MGSRTSQWCDRCGMMVSKLTGYWFGKPSDFTSHRDGIEPKYKVELCTDCLRAVQEETKTWTNYKGIPK